MNILQVIINYCDLKCPENHFFPYKKTKNKKQKTITSFHIVISSSLVQLFCITCVSTYPKHVCLNLCYPSVHHFYGAQTAVSIGRFNGKPWVTPLYNILDPPAPSLTTRTFMHPTKRESSLLVILTFLSRVLSFLQEHEFLAMQRVQFEKFCKELIELHRERMYNLEMRFLQDKHGLKRGLCLAAK